MEGEYSRIKEQEIQRISKEIIIIQTRREEVKILNDRTNRLIIRRKDQIKKLFDKAKKDYFTLEKICPDFEEKYSNIFLDIEDNIDDNDVDEEEFFLISDIRLEIITDREINSLYERYVLEKTSCYSEELLYKEVYLEEQKLFKQLSKLACIGMNMKRAVFSLQFNPTSNRVLDDNDNTEDPISILEEEDEDISY